MKFVRSMMLVAVAVTTSVAAAEVPKLPAIKGVKGIKADATVFKAATKWNTPLVLRSEADAGKYFSKAQLRKMRKQVDFKRQFVLVFAWEGSPTDTLTYNIGESFPEHIFFRLNRGRIAGAARPQVRIFVLRKKVKWTAR